MEIKNIDDEVLESIKMTTDSERMEFTEVKKEHYERNQSL